MRWYYALPIGFALGIAMPFVAILIGYLWGGQ